MKEREIHDYFINILVEEMKQKELEKQNENNEETTESK